MSALALRVGWTRAPERLVRVDVADAGHHALVEQVGFTITAAAHRRKASRVKPGAVGSGPRAVEGGRLDQRRRVADRVVVA